MSETATMTEGEAAATVTTMAFGVILPVLTLDEIGAKIAARLGGDASPALPEEWQNRFMDWVSKIVGRSGYDFTWNLAAIASDDPADVSTVRLSRENGEYVEIRDADPTKAIGRAILFAIGE